LKLTRQNASCILGGALNGWARSADSLKKSSDKWTNGTLLIPRNAYITCEWSACRLSRFTPEERVPRTHWIGSCVGPRAGLDDMDKCKFLNSPGLELRPLSRPVRSQSLYRLFYGDSYYETYLSSNYNVEGGVIPNLLPTDHSLYMFPFRVPLTASQNHE
jgi:hypothetical protein